MPFQKYQGPPIVVRFMLGKNIFLGKVPFVRISTYFCVFFLIEPLRAIMLNIFLRYCFDVSCPSLLGKNKTRVTNERDFAP